MEGAETESVACRQTANHFDIPGSQLAQPCSSSRGEMARFGVASNLRYNLSRHLKMIFHWLRR